MLFWFLMGFATLFGLGVLMTWMVNTEPKNVIKAFKWIALILLGGLVALFLFSGRLGLALAVLPAMIPFALRLWSLYSMGKTAHRTFKNARAAMGGGEGTGEASGVATDSLRMTLDHDSGSIDGEILQGPWAGKWLHDLEGEELLGFYQWCIQNDGESARIMETYLDRTHGPEWRDGEADFQQESAGDGGASFDGTMTRDEAYAILGLEPGATESEIKAAWHRLIAMAHPDKGGSTFLAAKINQAKDILLNG